jgi:hypothetical protein
MSRIIGQLPDVRRDSFLLADHPSANLASPSTLRRRAAGAPVRERLGSNHDSGRLSFRINPAQRGVERNSLPYQSRRKRAP